MWDLIVSVPDHCLFFTLGMPSIDTTVSVNGDRVMKYPWVSDRYIPCA